MKPATPETGVEKEKVMEAVNPKKSVASFTVANVSAESQTPLDPKPYPGGGALTPNNADAKGSFVAVHVTLIGLPNVFGPGPW